MDTKSIANAITSTLDAIAEARTHAAIRGTRDPRFVELAERARNRYDALLDLTLSNEPEAGELLTGVTQLIDSLVEALATQTGPECKSGRA